MEAFVSKNLKKARKPLDKLRKVGAKGKKLSQKILQKERQLADKYLLGKQGRNFREKMLGCD